MKKMKITKKYKELLKSNPKRHFLEGTTYAGKTTIGIGVKFIMEIHKSHQNKHFIAGTSKGDVESNIINAENGILDIWGDQIEYFGSGSKNIEHAHLKLGDNIIYIVGFDNIARYKKILGGQFGAGAIDEFQVADMNFIREAFMRCDYIMCTMNPDDPKLPQFQEFVNRAVPKTKSTPKSILSEIESNKDTNEAWEHWFFTFDDNKGLTESKKDDILTSNIKGTKMYKTKILGERARSTGLILYLPKKAIIQEHDINQDSFIYYVVGVDTSFSANTDDTTALMFCGITQDRVFIVLDEEVYNNKNKHIEEQDTAGDIVTKINEFAITNGEKWGVARQCIIDGEAVHIEYLKSQRLNGWLMLGNNANSFKGKMKVNQRAEIMNSWLAKDKYKILSHCNHHIDELSNWEWDEKTRKPADIRDHTINAVQYAFIPYRSKIGGIVC